jgi:hypothetical protein
MEAADRARDDLDRDHVHRGRRAPNRHQTTSTATATGGALSAEFDASVPLAPGGAGSQDRSDRR